MEHRKGYVLFAYVCFIGSLVLLVTWSSKTMSPSSTSSSSLDKEDRFPTVSQMEQEFDQKVSDDILDLSIRWAGHHTFDNGSPHYMSLHRTKNQSLFVQSQSAISWFKTNVANEQFNIELITEFYQQLQFKYKYRLNSTVEFNYRELAPEVVGSMAWMVLYAPRKYTEHWIILYNIYMLGLHQTNEEMIQASRIELAERDHTILSMI